MMAFVDEEYPWLICPSLLFLGTGGLSLFITDVQVSNLFSKGANSLVGLLSGAVDSSSVVQLFIKMAYEAGIRRQHSYFFLTGLLVIVVISTFLFFPKDFILPNTDLVATVELEINVKAGEKITAKEEQSTDKPKVGASFYMRNPAYIMHVVWFCILMLRFNIFLGTVNPWLDKITDHDISQVSHMTNVLSYCMLFGFVTSFVAGFMFDWQKRMYASASSLLRQKMMPAILPLMLASGLSTMLTILTFVPVLDALYATFIIFIFFRSFLFSIGIGYLSFMFPIEVFGPLFGVMYTIAGIVNLLQYALFRWSDAYTDAQMHVNAFLLCLGLISFSHPVYLWIMCRRERTTDTMKTKSQDQYGVAKIESESLPVLQDTVRTPVDVPNEL